MKEACYVGCAVRQCKGRNMGVSLSPGREVISCPLLTAKVLGSTLSPLARRGGGRGFPVRGDAQLSPSCRCCCFLLCLSSHQADCSPPRAVKGLEVGVKSRLSLGFITQTGWSRPGLYPDQSQWSFKYPQPFRIRVFTIG